MINYSLRQKRLTSEMKAFEILNTRMSILMKAYYNELTFFYFEST